MGLISHLWSLWTGIALCTSYCKAQNVLDVKNLISVGFDHPDTPHVEYICMGALEINFVNEKELLIGVCTPTIEDLSAAIGTLPISELDKPKTTGANLLYGSLNKPEPKGSDPNWDGIGVNASIKRPEQFYQTKDAIRFIDDRSCARKIDRATGQVKTILGKCADNTLDIPGAVLSACYGMTYFEDKAMWVFSVVNDGLYVYKEGGGSPRLILKQDHLSSVITSSSRQLIRGLDQYGNRNTLIWNKIKSGINYYNFTDIHPVSGNLIYGNNFVRYISATGKSPIDATARRHDKTDPAIGSSDADLSVSPNGKVLAIADISLDRLFFMDIANADKNNAGQIKPLQAVCLKKSGIIEDRLNNCTFSAISAAGWVNPSTFVTYEQKFGAFRKFNVTPQEREPEPTTTVPTAISTTSSADGLTGGHIAGIVISCCACVAIVIFVALCYYHSKKCQNVCKCREKKIVCPSQLSVDVSGSVANPSPAVVAESLDIEPETEPEKREKKKAKETKKKKKEKKTKSRDKSEELPNLRESQRPRVVTDAPEDV